MKLHDSQQHELMIVSSKNGLSVFIEMGNRLNQSQLNNDHINSIRKWEMAEENNATSVCYKRLLAGVTC